ncbi:Exosome complex component RRP42 [Mycena sanguinolenta]|uniref:Ribosomal RNA-processing protein 42 n=1 Tax=Mycena sanguinolenta TaxID=230812 RepID=A0A8H6YYS9_9AGAR|nr:Exosome complex component RRP42 [Mycena sanguinolenta]
MASVSTSKAEISYIQTGLLSNPPLRADGRGLHDFRAIALETGIAPLANGSAHLTIGKNPHDGGGGTEVLAAAKLEVETVDGLSEGVNGGRIVCTVSWCVLSFLLLSDQLNRFIQNKLAPRLPTHTSPHLRSTICSMTCRRSCIKHSRTRRCIRRTSVSSPAKNRGCSTSTASCSRMRGTRTTRCSWPRARRCGDCKVPRTRAVEYKASAAPSAKPLESGEMDVDGDADAQQSGFDTRSIARAVDFELPDYWDEGEVLGGSDKWPVCVTLNIASSALRSSSATCVHYLDASLQEEAATPLRLLLVFSFPPNSSPNLQAMRILGSGELESSQIREFVAGGEKYAQKMWTALNAKLKEEDVRRGQKARDRFARR